MYIYIYIYIYFFFFFFCFLFFRQCNEHSQKHTTGQITYGNNLLCRFSNEDMSIYKEDEQGKVKAEENSINTRKTVKHKYNINSTMSYRHLLNISKNSRLYVKKSNIHGYGLYTRELINEGEPVIEYIGEYIRNIISDKREKYYDKIESSCYMFRLNENIIIDATKWGNSSRFINHSCMVIKHYIIFCIYAWSNNIFVLT
uniref:[histone H3]-lysine(4) N-trimethyltransferase n=1 Tax=Piliocolobus tephrosceles TaxID=591936 RepID=A0A8C9H4T3_9PRIM